MPALGSSWRSRIRPERIVNGHDLDTNAFPRDWSQGKEQRHGASHGLGTRNTARFERPSDELKADLMRLMEGLVYYGIFAVGIACGYALFTSQLGPRNYDQYFVLGTFAVFGIFVGIFKIYDDATR